MSKEIRVLIADDHPIFRNGLKMVIEADRRLKVVAEAEDGESALAGIRQLQPDVTVLDIDMPPPDGFAVARQVLEERLPVGIIFLTMHKERSLFDAALNAGVKGFIVKDGAVNEIVGCIKAVAAGESFFSPTLSGHLLTKQKQAAQIYNLSSVERRVLLLVAESMRNKEIAEKMFLSVRTIEHHRANICAKLGLSGKNALLTFALTHKSEL